MYIIGIFKETNKQLNYVVFVFGIGSVILVLIDQITNIYRALSISIIFLTGMFSIIYRVMQNKPIPIKTQKKVSIRRILA
ncbi:hypothetical protein KKG31_02755 [Patescibacteria group bacterium]|nr:hypothetical protein [Patescibacteria group bacterium]MBU1758081.1 hypothetical protein [Patescibacteria group bacterium]